MCGGRLESDWLQRTYDAPAYGELPEPGPEAWDDYEPPRRPFNCRCLLIPVTSAAGARPAPRSTLNDAAEVQTQVGARALLFGVLLSLPIWAALAALLIWLL